MKLIWFLFLLGWLGACTQTLPVSGPMPQSANNFADTTLRQIHTYQDERHPAALLPYLSHAQPRYRQAAALALASVQATETIPVLLPLLADKDATVRRAAAYALGQTNEPAAEDGLIKYATLEKTAAVHAEITEALGKCATQKGLNYLVSFTPTNDLEKAGQIWGIYRTNAKKLNYDAATRKASTYLLRNNAQPVRLGAAHFLARTPQLNLSPYQSTLIRVATSEPSPEVRMAVATALGKIKNPAVLETLLQLVQTDIDYRVRINAIRALTGADFQQTKTPVYLALTHPDYQTALTAAEYLLNNAPPAEGEKLFQVAQQHPHWRVRATLLAAALKNHPRKALVNTLIAQNYTQTNHVYEQGALLQASATEVTNYRFIQQAIFGGASNVVATYGLQALADRRQDKNFPDSLKAPFAEIFRQAITGGEVALVGIAAETLARPELNFKLNYPDYSFLEVARDKLVLPRDVETYLALTKAINLFSGKAMVSNPSNPYTHPINWELVKEIRPQQKVNIKTTKGLITLQLFTEEAPATVANFVQLARSGFYNGKNFHRVVPNFVVQGGDPRGDGWGSTDYAIRTELANLRYGEGYVGMASAGKDTESCQWFITHSPTPHLDGRYTIFARVIAGMPVVHQLEIGDKIDLVQVLPAL